MGSRDIKELCPELYDRYQLFNVRMGEAGLIHVVTCTSRSILEQMALYVQGRLSLGDVNMYRHAAGLRPITLAENVIVTWTLDSRHVTNMFDADLNNDKARAFDICILNKAGQAVWDLKVSVNDNDIPDYREAAMVGDKVGLDCGGLLWGRDWPHYQLKGGR